MVSLTEFESMHTDDRQRFLGGTTRQPSSEMTAVAQAPRPTFVTITVLDSNGGGGSLLSFESPAMAKGALGGLGYRQHQTRNDDWIRSSRP